MAIKIIHENKDNKSLSDIIYMILCEMEKVEKDTSIKTGKEKKTIVLEYLDKKIDKESDIDIDMIGDLIEMFISISKGRIVIQKSALTRFFTHVISYCKKLPSYFCIKLKY